MPANPRHYTIAATCGGGLRSSTRCAAAGAMVLADVWADEGCTDILLTDPRGISRTRDGFRASLMRSYKWNRRLVLH